MKLGLDRDRNTQSIHNLQNVSIFVMLSNILQSRDKICQEKSDELAAVRSVLDQFVMNCRKEVKYCRIFS
jgi:hypothetical protein